MNKKLYIELLEAEIHRLREENAKLRTDLKKHTLAGQMEESFNRQLSKEITEPNPLLELVKKQDACPHKDVVCFKEEYFCNSCGERVLA